jgi:hypothetical protein
MKGWDRRGLEGLPLKLIIMSVIISLSAPVVMGSLDDFERSTARSRLVAQVSIFISVVQEVITGGDGNKRSITVSIPSASAKYGLVMDAGGQKDTFASKTVRCWCGGSLFSTYVLNDPPGRMTTINGDPLRLEEGEHHISIECKRIDGHMVALLSVDK